MSSKQVHGMRRGEVIDNLDPLEAGRVKVRVFGVYDDIPDSAIPWALYSDPFMGGNSDVGGLFVPDTGNHVWVFFEEGDPEQPVYFAGAPARSDGPQEASKVGTYPSNRVFKTKAGHVIEIDDTPEESRIRIAHKSASQKIWADNGDVEEQVMGKITIVVEQDANLHVKGNINELVDGNVSRQVDGNLNELIKGNVTRQVNGSVTDFVMGGYNTSVIGRRVEMSSGGSEYLTTGQMDVSGSRIDLNKKPGAAIEIEGGEDAVFIYSLEYAYSFGASRELVEAAGANAPFDSPEDADLKAENLASGEFPDEVEADGTEHEVEDAVVQQLEAGCPVLEDDVYKTPIGDRGLTVRSLTLDPIFKHKIQAQNGNSIEDIVCNMHHLCVNALDPLMEAFPSLRINSAFRRGTGGSQHLLGAAVDLQFPSGTNQMYQDVLDYIAANIAYDQVILESSNGGNTYWIHISYDRSKGSQRKSRLTWLGKGYNPGWNFA